MRSGIKLVVVKVFLLLAALVILAAGTRQALRMASDSERNQTMNSEWNAVQLLIRQSLSDPSACPRHLKNVRIMPKNDVLYEAGDGDGIYFRDAAKGTGVPIAIVGGEIPIGRFKRIRIIGNIRDSSVSTAIELVLEKNARMPGSRLLRAVIPLQLEVDRENKVTECRAM